MMKLLPNPIIGRKTEALCKIGTKIEKLTQNEIKGMSSLTTILKILDFPQSYCFLFFYLFYFTIIVLVLPYINMHLPRVYMCSPS